MTTRYYGTNTQGNVYVTTDDNGEKTTREYTSRGNAIYVIQDVPGVTMFSEVWPDGVRPGESLEDAVRRMFEGEPESVWAGKVVKWMGWLLIGALLVAAAGVWIAGFVDLASPTGFIR
jgi:hypothetical protein